MSHPLRNGPAETSRDITSSGPETPVSIVVVRAVAAAAETPPEELPPLTDVVDPDALDGLFSSPDASGSVRFRYAGHSVTVSTDGSVTVVPDGD